MQDLVRAPQHKAPSAARDFHVLRKNFLEKGLSRRAARLSI
jgi:hypothetical protein